MSEKHSEVDELFSEDDLTGLVDLRKFLADELGQSEGDDLSRAFTPLTNGLGVQATAVKPPPVGAVKAGPSSFQKEIPLTERKSELTQTSRIIVDPSVEEAEEDLLVTPVPPPVPSASLARRALAGLVDQCFVWVGWLLALAITTSAISGGKGELSSRFLKEFSDPSFLRFAGIEFCVLWLCYLVLSIGFLEMTFGMWVWGIRMTFGENPFWKKVARITLSWLIYPWVAPIVLLLFRKEGNNLIDSLTQSQVYRTQA